MNSLLERETNHPAPIPPSHPPSRLPPAASPAPPLPPAPAPRLPHLQRVLADVARLAVQLATRRIQQDAHKVALAQQQESLERGEVRRQALLLHHQLQQVPAHRALDVAHRRLEPPA